MDLHVHQLTVILRPWNRVLEKLLQRHVDKSVAFTLLFPSNFYRDIYASVTFIFIMYLYLSPKKT